MNKTNPFSKKDYTQTRHSLAFIEWVREMNTLVYNDSELAKRMASRSSQDELLKLLATEAIPLALFLENNPFDGTVTMSADNEKYDAILQRVSIQTRTEIQIVSTESAQGALTRLHMVEFGNAPITHGISTQKQVAQWKKDKKEVYPVAVNSQSELEEEICVMADRIKAKVQKNYSPGMDLLVWCYTYRPSDSIADVELRDRVLAKLNDVSLTSFNAIYLAEQKRTVRLK